MEGDIKIPLPEQVHSELDRVTDPELHKSLIELDMVGQNPQQEGIRHVPSGH